MSATNFVPVVVNLMQTTLKDLHQTRSGVTARASEKEALLLAELGANAWQSGRWSNGVGQIEIYVNAQGLKQLAGSSNAQAFWPGKGWIARSGLDNSDGRLDSLDRALAAGTFAEVELVPNVDGLQFDLDRSGAVRYGESAAETLRAKASAILSGLPAGQIADQAASLAKLSQPNSQAPLSARLSREGVAQLALSGSVRSLRALGFTDARPRKVDAELAQLADGSTKEASAEVIITLRDPMLGGQLSWPSLDARKSANRRAFAEIFADAGIDGAAMKDLSLFSAATGKLGSRQLRALLASSDARVLSIEMNRPVASAMLATSTATLNMQSAWGAGYVATGQSVVVMDTGTQTSHAFLRNAAGVSRVTFEACFGTNAVQGSTTFQSVCPSQNALGDKPLGLVGAGAPVSACSTQQPAQCDHGTHVAGIAAGRNSTLAPANLQGVAPGVSVIAAQVFSFDQQRVVRPVVFSADLIAAMDAAVNAMPQGSVYNPYTINLSLGGGLFSVPCAGAVQGFTNAAVTLKNLGIPVVAASGNDFATGSVAWPACVPGVIQVSSVSNDGVGNTRSNFGGGQGANLARPVQFPAEYMWLVPGGGNGTAIVSSRLSAPGTAAYGGQQGTSQAAPHVAGIYAVAKAALPNSTVDQVSEWLRANARVFVPNNMCVVGPCVPSDTVNFDRIRVPSL